MPVENQLGVRATDHQEMRIFYCQRASDIFLEN